MFCGVTDLHSFRILNSVFRGRVVANASHLEQALKIIMHSNYIHTRDHPQRNHQSFDLDLDEIDWVDAPPSDHDRGSGFVFADFHVGDDVLVWIHRDWWSGKVTYMSRAQTLSVRMVGMQNSTPGILPKHTKPALVR